MITALVRAGARCDADAHGLHPFPADIRRPLRLAGPLGVIDDEDIDPHRADGGRPMMAGHFGLAATVKAAAPRTPLWALMLATQFLDVVFVVLLLAGGVENLTTVTGGTYGESLIHAYWSHSLVGAAVLALAYGAFGAWRWGRTAGLVLGSTVFSHWLLDLLVHRADLPVLPGNAGDLPLLGLGLWRTPWASTVVELALVLIGAVAYARSIRRRATITRRGVAAAATMALMLGAELAVDVMT
jgi:hypothetical protein